MSSSQWLEYSRLNKRIGASLRVSGGELRSDLQEGEGEEEWEEEEEGRERGRRGRVTLSLIGEDKSLLIHNTELVYRHLVKSHMHCWKKNKQTSLL